MKCTFYRPETVNFAEWKEIREKLLRDLNELETGKVKKQEAVLYLQTLLPQAEILERNPRMRFFGMDLPQKMPSDIRVDYYFWPTYIAAMIAMKICLLWPGILDRVNIPGGESARDILRAVLLGCTGRGFRGHGYDDVRGLVEVTEFFVDHGTIDFLEISGTLCMEFTECLNQALLFLLAGVMQGSVAGAWGDNYTERAYSILAKSKMLTPEEKKENMRYYLAYGSNLNTRQMKMRCPDAQEVGTTELPGWRLMFKGSKSGNYLTIEMEDGYTVPVAVWAVSETDEQNLDRYEGFPTFYYKRELEVGMRDAETGKRKMVSAFVYIMHEDRKLGKPTERYMACCREGYAHFGFDPAFLEEAYDYSSRE